MKEQKKVSILIPCYNSEEFLGETLLSCVRQDYPEVEIIVVDDGSSDKSCEIAKEWASKYDNIQVFRQPNSGACRARNLAFEHSSGDYIMYLDADDIISPNKISEQVAALSVQSSTAVATGRWARFHDSLEGCVYEPVHCSKNYGSGKELLFELWETGEMFATSSYLVPRHLIIEAGPWIDGLKKNQDGEYFSRVLLKCGSVRYCPESTSYYRTGEYDSVSKDNSKAKVEALLHSFEEYKRNVLTVDNTKRAKEALARNFSLFRYIYNGKYPDLSRRALCDIKELGVKSPVCGTRRVRMISKVIGFENFLRIRKLLLGR